MFAVRRPLSRHRPVRGARPGLITGGAVVVASVLTLGAAGAVAAPAKPAAPSKLAAPAKPAAAKAAAPSNTVSVTVPNLPAMSGPIPSTFLGLSFESAALALPQLDPAVSNLAQLLAALGPGELRFGGTTLDRDTMWEPPGIPMPSWASIQITAADLQRLNAFSQASGWRVVLGLNLRSKDATAAADEAATAVRILGSNLVGFEIGNEPEAYAKYNWRPAGYGPSDYFGEVQTYAAALAAAAPGVPLIGPASNSADYATAFALAVNTPGVELTGHSYSLTACGGIAPTIQTLLGGGVALTTQNHVSALVASGTAFGRPVRIAETNSIACGGDSSASDTQAGGLWAADDMLRVAQLGAVGINFHGGVPGVCRDGITPWYAPVCAPSSDNLGAGIYRPEPEWYAMRALRPVMGTSLTRVVTTNKPGHSVRAWATIGPDGTRRVVLINPAAQGNEVVQVNAPALYGIASIDQTSAPALDSREATTFDGLPAANDGSILGTSLRLIDKAGVVRFGIPAASITVLTLSQACTVPNLTGLPSGGATKALAAAGCQTGRITTHQAPKGQKAQYVVSGQQIRAGRVGTYATKVNFVLSPKKAPPKPKKTAAKKK